MTAALSRIPHHFSLNLHFRVLPQPWKHGYNSRCTSSWCEGCKHWYSLVAGKALGTLFHLNTWTSALCSLWRGRWVAAGTCLPPAHCFFWLGPCPPAWCHFPAPRTQGSCRFHRSGHAREIPVPQCWVITSSRMAQKCLRPDVVTQIPCPSQLCEHLTPLSLNPPTLTIASAEHPAAVSPSNTLKCPYLYHKVGKKS